MPHARKRQRVFSLEEAREMVLAETPIADSDSEEELNDLETERFFSDSSPTRTNLGVQVEEDNNDGGLDLQADSDSEFEDNEDEDDMPMNSEDGTEELPWINLREGDRWTSSWLQNEPRTRARLLFDTNENTNELEYFIKFFPEQLFDLMARESNRYAYQVRAAKGVLQQHARLNKWYETTSEEMKAFTGLQVAMGLVTKPALANYWEENWLVATPGFGKVMSRERFEMLNSMLHFADNTLRIPRGEQGHDILYKIRPVIDIVRPTYLQSYEPGLSLSIDESMAPFKGRLHFKQYMPLKPNKWGVKFWVIADAQNGFCLDWKTYTGREEGNVQGGVTARIVKDLTRPFYGSGRHVYMDNFYTSPELFQDLAKEQLGACGTLRLNRRGVPQEMKEASNQSRKGDPPAFFEKGNLLGVTWHDTKRVSMLSTIHDSTTISKQIRDRRSATGVREVTKPRVVEEYNKNMAGVDILDQRMSYYRYPHRHMKWYRVIYHFLMEVALVNAFLASNLSAGQGRKQTVRNFRLNLINGLTAQHRKREAGRPKVLGEVNRQEDEVRRFRGQHFALQYNIDKYKPDCIVCKRRAGGRKQGRHQTTWYCEQCQLPLCNLRNRNCFKDYHTLVKYW